MNAITMDTVRDLIEQHSDHISGNTREFYNGAYAEIADELNSRAERTCIMSVIADWEYGDGEEDWELLCSNCGDKEWYRMGEHPNYCPECGARVKCEWES